MAHVSRRLALPAWGGLPGAILCGALRPAALLPGALRSAALLPGILLAAALLPAPLLREARLQAATAPGRPQDGSAAGRDAYDRALKLEAHGNHAAALALLWSAAGLTPHDAEVQNHLGEALERIGALDAAVDAYRHALEDRPTFHKAANNLILALAKSGKGPEAVARARVLVAASPGDAARHFTLALALSEEDVEQAIVEFRRVLDLDPGHTLARYNLGLVLKRADRLPEAVAVLTRAVETDPRPEAFYTLGVIYWQQGDTAAAARALRAAVSADPRHTEAHYTLGAVLAARRDWRGAAASLRRAIALRPGEPGAHYTLARVLRELGDEGGAAAELAATERLRRQAQLEREAAVRIAVGTRKVDAGDLTGGLDEFRRAAAALDTYAPAHYQMGLVLSRLGEPEAARAAFARAAALDPDLLPPPAGVR